MITLLSEVAAANDILSYLLTEWTAQKSYRPIITHLEDAHQRISGDNVCIYSCKKTKIKKQSPSYSAAKRPL